MRFRKPIIVMLIFGLCLSTAGCYSIAGKNFELYGQGRFSELAKYEENELTKTDKDTVAKTTDLYYLCEAYSNLKQYNKLFKCVDDLELSLKQAQLLLIGVPTRPAMIRAAAYLELGNYAEAIKQAEKIEPEAPLDSPDIQMWRTIVRMRRLSLLTRAYVLNNKGEKAEETLKSLEAITIPVYGWGRILTEKRNCIAKALMALGKYDKVLQQLTDGPGLAPFSFLYRPAGNLILSGTHPFAEETYDSYVQVPRLYMLSRAELETGDIAKAKIGYDLLLNRAHLSSNGEIHWMTLYDRGRISEKEGSLSEAIDFYKRAIEAIEQQRSTINTEVNKIGFVGDKQDVYHRTIRALFIQKEYEKAFEYAERAKARALVDLLSSTKEFAIKGGNEEKIRTILSLKDDAEAIAVTQDISIDSQKTRGIIKKTTEDLKVASPELASLVTVTAPIIAEIMNQITNKEVLIEYYYHKDDLYAFLLSEGGVNVVQLDRAGLEDDVDDLRRSLQQHRSSRSIDLLKKLHGRLFQPVEGLIKGNSLTIVPHGVLHHTPFAALHDGNGYLVDRFSIRLMPSADALRYLLDRRKVKRNNILVFGNPDLGKPRLQLKYAEKEAIGLASIFPGSKVLLRNEATEGALRTFGGGYTYIHFATHGQFNASSPLRSALFLTPDKSSDGMLTVEKVYSLQLNADLVTLSACETGLGRIDNGDDIIGLTRGFLYAGCSGILASLWQVDDQATEYLMVRFYKELESNSKRSSLRNAQIETKKRYSNPFYWASFQLIGFDQ